VFVPLSFIIIIFLNSIYSEDTLWIPNCSDRDIVKAGQVGTGPKCNILGVQN
jgi:hypothetical protein